MVKNQLEIQQKWIINRFETSQKLIEKWLKNDPKMVKRTDQKMT